MSATRLQCTERLSQVDIPDGKYPILEELTRQLHRLHAVINCKARQLGNRVNVHGTFLERVDFHCRGSFQWENSAFKGKKPDNESEAAEQCQYRQLRKGLKQKGEPTRKLSTKRAPDVSRLGKLLVSERCS